MTHFLMGLPMWFAYAVVALAIALGISLVLLWVMDRVSAWADREITDALASPPSITDGFTDMGEQADTVVWIFGDERPRLTVIDGGNEAA